jgi:hypothetical protein
MMSRISSTIGIIHTMYSYGVHPIRGHEFPPIMSYGLILSSYMGFTICYYIRSTKSFTFKSILVSTVSCVLFPRLLNAPFRGGVLPILRNVVVGPRYPQMCVFHIVRHGVYCMASIGCILFLVIWSPYTQICFIR